SQASGVPQEVLAPEAIPEALPAEPHPRPRRLEGETVAPEPLRQPVVDAAGLEAWIGRRGRGWVAVGLLLFAAAFFLKYAFENQWIGPLGRISIGIVAGVLLCGTGLHYHGKGWRIFSQMMTAGGVVLLYL